MIENKNIRNFCIIAHIDHGKSTLADRMLEMTNTIEKRKMKEQVLDKMDLERERGITIKLQSVRMIWKTNSNFEAQNTKQLTNNKFLINKQKRISDSSNSEYILNLIDTPGHVDFSYEVSRTLAAVEGAILLVDATQGIQAQTLANLHEAQKQNLDILPVINKIDMPNAKTDETKEEIAKLLKIDKNKILAISAKTGENVDKLFPIIIKNIKPPKINTNNDLRALIFDSVYDSYRGVVAYVKIVDGEIKKDNKIKFLATNTLTDCLEVGFFNPNYQKSDKLLSGEIGYIVTGLKDIASCKVGDTITISNTNIKPLTGYKKIKPMVFAGIYTKDGAVEKLRDALMKLSLNDSSLEFEPENSSVFGFGFKCGFLGLLHLEIIKERLIREYNLDLIITTPQVNYLQKFYQGKNRYLEPWASLEIVTPNNYIGQIMKLVMDIRGKYIDTKYLTDRAIIYFEAPLANIITNFYDNLKSVSSGFASLNYEFLDYRMENLVKMDILISDELIDTLSQIVHKDELLAKARNIVKKLKDNLPKQMFKIVIQAAVGGKIIAREDISPLKKDVTGHLYGGDITRKRKLWEKQKKGKKKMQRLGKIDIPTDIFIKILKN